MLSTLVNEKPCMVIPMAAGACVQSNWKMSNEVSCCAYDPVLAVINHKVLPEMILTVC